MSEPSRLDDDEREELVAFLDGELSDDDAHKVEAKLNLDPQTRAEADALRKTWDLLDYLPRSEPSPNFTNRTLERIAPIRRTQSMPRRRPWRLVALGLAWSAALLLAVGTGYGGVWLYFKVQARQDQADKDQARQQSPRDPTDKDLARDLRLIENKRLFELGEDMDFLRDLNQPDLFGDETLGS